MLNGLWALAFGKGGATGAPDRLFFSSGPHAWRGPTELGVHGLLGSIAPVVEAVTERGSFSGDDRRVRCQVLRVASDETYGADAYFVSVRASSGTHFDPGRRGSAPGSSRQRRAGAGSAGARFSPWLNRANQCASTRACWRRLSATPAATMSRTPSTAPPAMRTVFQLVLEVEPLDWATEIVPIPRSLPGRQAARPSTASNVLRAWSTRCRGYRSGRPAARPSTVTPRGGQPPGRTRPDRQLRRWRSSR